MDHEILEQQHNNNLDKAILAGDSDTISKIIDMRAYPCSQYMYKISDIVTIRKIIHKWRNCTFDKPVNTDNMVSLLFSPDLAIVKEFLDYLVDPQTTPPIRSLIYGDIQYFGTSGQELSNPATKSAHDATLRIFLQYYPQLKKKYSGTVHYDPEKDYQYQQTYITSRILCRPTENVPTLKLMIDTFNHRDQSYLQDLFKKSCAINNVAVVKCALELNHDFYAEIKDGVVTNYKIRDVNMVLLKGKLDSVIMKIDNKISDSTKSIKTDSENICRMIGNKLKEIDGHISDAKIDRSNIKTCVNDIEEVHVKNLAEIKQCVKTIETMEDVNAKNIERLEHTGIKMSFLYAIMVVIIAALYFNIEAIIH